MNELEKLQRLVAELESTPGMRAAQRLQSEIDALDPYSRFPTLKSALELGSVGREILDQFSEHELKYQRLLQDSGFNDSVLQAQQTIERINSNFRVPQHTELQRLMENLGSGYFSARAPWVLESSALEVMESLQSPWLYELEPTRSIESVYRLTDLGQLLREPTAYSVDVAQALRQRIGDWRDEGLWPDDEIEVLDRRGEMYVEVGFDEQLTELPEPAFRETTTRVELRTTLPVLSTLYGDSADEDTGTVYVDNAQEAYTYLRHFETGLRDFIERAMTARFGERWPRSQLPNGMYERWSQRREADRIAGRVLARLVDYADFTDYESIITRKDNWREVFKAHFQREESVREAFNRLRPIRLAVMHARPVTRIEELLIYVETTRLLQVRKP